MREGKNAFCQNGKIQGVSSTDLHAGPVLLIKTGDKHTVADPETGGGRNDELKESNELVDLIHGEHLPSKESANTTDSHRGGIDLVRNATAMGHGYKDVLQQGGSTIGGAECGQGEQNGSDGRDQQQSGR